MLFFRYLKKKQDSTCKVKARQGSVVEKTYISVSLSDQDKISDDLLWSLRSLRRIEKILGKERIKIVILYT